MARTPGAKGKVNQTAKENLIAVFTRLGGTAAMAEWAKDNLTDFYRLYARLVPQQIDVDVNVRPCDVSAEPLKAEDWDAKYGEHPTH